VTQRAHRELWCARPSPKGPTHLASASEPNDMSVEDGCPQLGIPDLEGVARKRGPKGGNQAGREARHAP
jgi:hypothetical protein